MRGLKLYLLLLIVTLSFQVRGQKNISALFMKNEERGDVMYKDLYYEQAAVYYELALKKNPTNSLRLKLADTYRKMHDYERSASMYVKVLAGNDTTDAVNKYRYAQVLMSLGELDEARKWYEDFRNEIAGDPRVDDKLYIIDNFDRLFRDSSMVRIQIMPFNSEYSDFGTVVSNKQIVFSSARGKNSFVDPDYYRDEDLMDLYTVNLDSSGGFGTVKEFSKGINTQFHEGPLSFYSDGMKLIFTRSNRYNGKTTVGSDGQTKLQLFSSTKSGGEWGQIAPLPINRNEYSLAHPSLNATNDTLYFASDIPGGFGGMDIYMSVWRDGKWSDIVNMGDQVNTSGDELYPFFIQDRLFFSSDGHGSMGGLDILKVKIRNGKAGRPVNLGYPINSSTDDFAYYLVPESNRGFFSSNRSGGAGQEDIYGFSREGYVLSGVALNEQTGEALSEVNLKLIENGQTQEQALTDSAGNFHFYLPLDSDLEIEAFKEGYDFEDGIEVSTRGNPVDMDTLYIRLRYQDLFVTGIVYDNQTQGGIHDASVVLNNLTENRSDTVITDREGRYQFPIKPDQEFSAMAFKEHFFPDSLKFTSYGIDSGRILNDFILNEEFIDKEVIYFDYNSYVIKRNARPTLQKVLALMKKFPDDFLIIGAHADARGTVEYNQKLSDNRANEVLQYFVSRGIDRSRIIARGFGEAFVINRCSDGVNCEEEDHSKNRRTELTIEEELPEEEFERN